MRTIGIGYKEINDSDNLEEMSKDPTYDGVRAIEDHGLTLVSIHGIMDIVREAVPRAVEKCKKAGIKVRMVTGDNKITAEAIAKKCGIWGPDSIYLYGGC